MTKLLLAVIATVALLVTGCTPGAAPSPASTPAAPPPAESGAGPSDSTSAASSAEPTDAEPTDAGPTDQESTETESAAGCPDGRYVLVKFSERGTGTNELSATGTDLTATFADGRYTMRAPGEEVYKLSNGTVVADMVLKGTMTGRYTGTGDAVTYRLSKAEGELTVKAAGQNRTESMKSAAGALAPQGKVPTTCTGDRMTMTLPLALLEFERS